ncbi:C39 family peptidase [Candidatus Woesearchaeota archaeon]|nr:C39 family peptidase [Candidatus Woesearchaeota archaeon]
MSPPDYNAYDVMIFMDKIMLEDLVMREQKNGYFCALASMQSYIFYLTGREVSQERLFDISYNAEKHLQSIEHDGILKQPDEGCGTTGIIAIAKEVGLKGFIKKNASLDELKYFLQNKLPVLVNWQYLRPTKDDNLVGHYSIIRGFEMLDNRKHKIFVADPGAKIYGNQSFYYALDYDEFNKRWFDPVPSDKGWMAVFFNDRIKKPSRIPFSGRYL